MFGVQEAFADRSVGRIRGRQSVLCVKLVPDVEMIVARFKQLVWRVCARKSDPVHRVGNLLTLYCEQVIQATAEFAVWIVIDPADFLRYGHHGMAAYDFAVRHARDSGLLVISDGAYRNDPYGAVRHAHTMLGNMPLVDERGDFILHPSPIKADACMIDPSGDEMCAAPFMQQVLRSGSGLFMHGQTEEALCRGLERPMTFSREAFVDELMERLEFGPVARSYVLQLMGKHARPVSGDISEFMNAWAGEAVGVYGQSSVGVVVTATDAGEMQRLREQLPAPWFLVRCDADKPEWGDIVASAATEEGYGVAAESSLSLIYPEDGDIAAAAERARDQLNVGLSGAGKGKAFL